MLELAFGPDAERELAEAHAWYEAQRPGLGAEFLLCVEAAIDVTRCAHCGGELALLAVILDLEVAGRILRHLHPHVAWWHRSRALSARRRKRTLRS